MSANEESDEPRIASIARFSAFIVARGFRFPARSYGNGEAKFPSLPRFYINLSLLCASRLRFFEIARVLVRFDDVARIIVNANHSAM